MYLTPHGKQDNGHAAENARRTPQFNLMASVLLQSQPNGPVQDQIHKASHEYGGLRVQDHIIKI
jgi:hypothetical protein